MPKSSILIVEDERIVVLDIQNSLEDCGYVVVGQADRGKEAVQKAAELRPDLVLMDIGLKGEMDGIEAAQQIRARFDLPVIFLTAFADPSTLERARRAEPFGYILKPFDQRDLVSNIEMALYKHRLEQSRRESEQKYRSLFETMAQGVVHQDREGRIISANPAARQLLGLTMEQMQGQTSIDPRWQTLHEDGSAFPGEIHPAMVALRTGQPVRDVLMSVFNPEKDAYVWLMVNAIPQYRPGASQPDQVFTTFTDITLRKQAEIALKESESKFHNVIENSSDGIVLVDSQGNLIEWNPAAERISGLKRSEVIGQPLWEVIFRMHPEEKRTPALHEALTNRWSEAVKNKYANGPDQMAELDIETPQGERRVVQTNGFVIETAQGMLAGAIMRDVTEQKRAVEKLNDSELRYRRLFEAAKDGILILDAETGMIVDVNPFLTELLGFSPEEFRSKRLWELGFFKDIVANQANFLELQQKKYIRYEDLPLETAHGQRIYVEFVSNVYQVNHRKVIQCNIRDISERKRTEDALREANLVVENSPVVLFRWKPAEGWPVEMVSQNVSQFGYTPEELLSGAVLFASMVYPEDLDRVAREVQEYSASGADQFQQEYRIVTKDGRVRWLDDRTMVQRNSAGQVVFYQGVVIDVTERKQAEAELRKLSQAVEQSANVIVMTDVEGNIEYVNPKFVEITGYSLAEAIGQNPRILNSREHRVEFYQHMWQTIKAGGVWQGEFHNRRKDGTLYWEDATIAPVYDSAGKLVNFIAVKEDITARKMLETAERDQRQLAEALRDTSVVLNSTLKLDEVLDRILDNIGRMAPYDAMILLLIEGDTVRIARQRSSLPLHPEKNASEAQLKLADLPILQSLIKTRQPCLISDTQTDPGWKFIIPNTQWVRSFVSIPLEIRGNIVGAINLASAEPDFFSTLQVERLQAFASQAAVAIENAQLYEQAQYLSTTDPLTELNNRRYLFDIGDFELARIGRYGGPLSAIMIDIDHFKNLNDTYGHAVGDLALREVARRIKKCVRTVDIVARVGGEEFVILMPETGVQAAFLVAERIRQSVAESPVVNHGLVVCTTLSLGVAEIDQNCKNLDDLLKRADQALYAAKAAGRNRPASYQTNG